MDEDPADLEDRTVSNTEDVCVIGKRALGHENSSGQKMLTPQQLEGYASGFLNTDNLDPSDRPNGFRVSSLLSLTANRKSSEGGFRLRRDEEVPSPAAEVIEFSARKKGERQE